MLLGAIQELIGTNLVRCSAQKLEYEKLQAQISSAASTSRDFPGELRNRKSKASGPDGITSDEADDKKHSTSLGPIPFNNGLLSVLVAISVGSSLLSFYVTKKMYQ